MARYLNVLLFVAALQSRFVCYPGIFKVPDENGGTDDVLYDSAEVMKINRLRDMLKKMTEGGTYGNVNSSEVWLDDFNQGLENLKNHLSQTSWDYQTNISNESAAKTELVDSMFINWTERHQPAARRFYYHFKRCDRGLAPCNEKVADLTRAFKVIVTTESSAAPKDVNKRDEMLHLSTQLESIYATAKVYRDGVPYEIEPGLTEILARSRDYDELLWAWSGWRNKTGRPMRDKYDRFVQLKNEGARSIGLKDTGSHWRKSNYEMDESLEKMVDDLYQQVIPLYRQLHAYVRRKLSAAYSERGFEPTGHIPAHLLGNMWAQQWVNIYDLVVPFPEVESINVTAEMVAQNYTPQMMFEVAENFFTSIGLEKMTPTFWRESMMVKPADREVVCHASAFDFFVGDDYRIKMCTTITQESLQTVHHEMGHIEYFMLYRPLPAIFRAGANAAFHEAVGDTIALSVMTPAHLQAIGLLQNATPPDADTKHKRDLNFLMKTALEKVAFLPFGYLIDKYRWEVFRGNINSTNYNSKWWEYRLKFQGVSPPLERTEEDFDPGAKYHVAANVPYIRYFLSFIGQFQFHQALCEAAGRLDGTTNSLHRCDIYRSKVAGLKLRAALRLGNSRPWRETMTVLTGQPDFNASAIKSYFKPLTDWLKEQNRNAGDKVGWDGEEFSDPDSLEQTTDEEDGDVIDALLDAITQGG